MAADNDILLRIEIKNKEPLELMDLTKSFVALASQFNYYVAREGQTKEDREGKLYVREIKTGSVILDLIEFATQSAIPFLENVNTIIGFAEYLKSAYNFLLGKEDAAKVEFTQSDCKDFAQIVNPIANDSASQLNINTVVNNNITNVLVINSTEANAAQNILDKLSKQLKSPEPAKDIQNKVLLTLFQTRGDTKATSGNKGIIEDICATPISLLFSDEQLNRDMLHQSFSPYEKIFVVDVQLQHVGGKVAAYKVLKLHEIIDKE